MSDENQGLTTCRIVCLLLGILAGALVWYLLEGNVGSLAQVILALLAFVCVAYGLYLAFCGKETQGSVPSESSASSSAAATASSDTASQAMPVANLTSEPKAPAKASGSKTTAKKSTKAATKSAASSKPKAKTTKAAASKASTAKTTAAKSTATKKAPAKKAPAKKAGPERLTKPKGGKGDDLKMIAGVGPKLEKTLNGLGFWHFEQIAKWKKADIAIVDDELSFKGRIERDDWIKQAKALAKGGEAEYIKVFGKKPR